MGSLLSFGVTAPLVALGKSAFDTFSKFENSMMKVNAVTSASVGEFKMLTAEAKRLGSTTQFTAQQVSDLQLVLGRKGFDPTAIKGMEGAILDLALATGEDLSLAANVVASSINVFGKEASDAASIANTLASASAKSSIQLSTFSTAFGHAGASAQAVGVDIEELSAMMGVLMDNGIKASKAGTGLRTAFSKLNEQGIPFIATLDKLASGQMTLNQATKLVGRTGANQLLILAENQEKVKSLTNEYRTNTTELGRMTTLMGSTAENKVKLMNSAIEGLKLDMGALLADVILPMIDGLIGLVNRFKGLDDSTKNLIINVGGFLAVLGPVLLTIGALISLLNPITGGLLLLGAAFVAVEAGSVKSSAALEKESKELAILTQAATSAAEGSELRLDIIEDIQAKYPDYLGNLDAEKVSNEDLATAASKYNEQLLKRIILKRTEEKLTDKLNKVVDAKENQKKKLIEVNKLASEYNDKFLGGSVNLNNLTPIKQVDAIIAKVKELNLNLGGTGKGKTKAAGVFLTGLKSTLGMFSGASTYLDSTKQELEDINKEMAELAEELGLSLVTLNAASSGSSGSGGNSGSGGGGGSNDSSATSSLDFSLEYENYLKLLAMLEKTKIATQEWKNAVNSYGLSIANTFATAFANVVLSGESLLKGLGNIFVSIAKQIASMIIKAGVLAAIFAMIPGLGAANIAAGGASGFKGIFQSMLGGSFADGGSPPVGKMSLVGEQGPELFVPNQSGTIIPNGSLGGGGASYIPNVTISGDDLLIVFDRANRRKSRR